MNAFGNATTTIIQQFAYPVTEAPEYKTGFRTTLGLLCGMVVWVFVVRYCEMKAQRPKLAAEDTVVDGEEPVGGRGEVFDLTVRAPKTM